MFKSILTLSFVASVCLGELIPISNYIGEHKFHCDYGTGLTGALVGGKIHTFGGCFPIPYIVDPSSEDFNSFIDQREHTNVSEAIQVYDITEDEWTAETDVKTPHPWRHTQVQTYKQNIYFHSISARRYSDPESSMWKYDTDIKEWTRLADLPFLWFGLLASCQINGKIYFSGTGDGRFRNIVQVYDAEEDQWEKPIFLNKRLTIRQMLCSDESIIFLGQEINDRDEDKIHIINMGDLPRKSYQIFSSDYNTGNTISHGLNITGNFQKVAARGNWFYFYDIGRSESVISKLNTITHEYVTLGTIPYTLERPLFVPYKDDQVLLFGGGKKSRRYHRQEGSEEHVNSIKTYNHKLIATNTNENDDIKLVLQK